MSDPREMTSAKILAEIEKREQWRREVDLDECSGGSPFEHHYERLDELDAELKRRAVARAKPDLAK